MNEEYRVRAWGMEYGVGGMPGLTSLMILKMKINHEREQITV